MAENSTTRRILFMVGLAFLVIVVAGATSFGVLWYMSQPDNGEAMEEEMGPTYELGEYTVNMTGASRYNFLQTTIVIEISEEEVIEEIEERSPQVQDRMISVLRNISDEDLDEPGVPEVKQSIKDVLNDIVSAGEVRSVWFTDFVVQ